MTHGDRQNLGNFLSTRSSTRISRPPGGASSLSLSWGQDSSPYNTGQATTPRPLRDDVSVASTMTQSSRVRAPPGGTSSVCLGWGDDRNVAQHLQTHSQSRSAYNSQCQEAFAEIDEYQEEQSHVRGVLNVAARCHGDDCSDLHFDRKALKILKARMSQRQKAQKEDTSSRFVNQKRDCLPIFCSGSTNSEGQELYAPPSRRERPEVDGSRPKVWKPALMPLAPPGGLETYNIDASANLCSAGRKRFPDGCAGSNRDMEAVEALRFYQNPGEHLGKQRLSAERRPQAEKHALDTHRYYLDGAGGHDVVPGKARGSATIPYASRQPLLAWEDASPAIGCKASRRYLPSSQSTCIGSSESSMQEFLSERCASVDNDLWGQQPVHEETENDDLPLGAEWCTFYDETL